MKVVFGKPYLSALYIHGSCDDKHHRFQPSIIRRYQRVIELLVNARDIASLWPFKSLNYEVLTGDKAGYSSVRVNNQYRVEFTVSQEVEEDKRTITVCNIEDLTNHYQ